MKRLLFVVGTRPEAIKIAPVLRALEEISANVGSIEFRVCVTAQHRQLLDQVLELFKIYPDYDLNIMRGGQDLTDTTSRALTGLRDVLTALKPDCVIVHGDTNTTLSACLAAYYQKIPVAHIEAGLRTNNIYSPWPEEINRRVTSVIASLHFAPTERARSNLIAQGVSPDSIHVTGNTVIDALLWATSLLDAEKVEQISQAWFPKLDTAKRLILVTGHRRENFGGGFQNICDALKRIVSRKDVEIIYPVHLNPNVRVPVNEYLAGDSSIHLIEPLDYLPFVYLMTRSHLILTDSGGIQEEAPSLGKPVLVMRDTTERPEGIEAGAVKLVGTNSDTVVAAVNMLLDDKEIYDKMSTASNPYGDGRAASRIASRLIEWR